MARRAHPLRTPRARLARRLGLGGVGLTFFGLSALAGRLLGCVGLGLELGGAGGLNRAILAALFGGVILGCVAEELTLRAPR